MSLEFSTHAKEQLTRRNISAKRINETVYEPEEVRESYKKKKLRRKLFGGRILQVVTITEGSRITVVSAYYLRRK